MAKFFQLVAVTLTVAVLGSTQCVEACSFLSTKSHAKTSQAAEYEMPCHHENGHEDSKLPANDPPCSHREFVAEKLSKVSFSDELQSICFITVSNIAQFVPVALHSPVVAGDETFPRFSPLILCSILRI